MSEIAGLLVACGMLLVITGMIARSWSDGLRAGRLPGDVWFECRAVRVCIPLGTTVVISVVLSMLLNLLIVVLLVLL